MRLTLLAFFVLTACGIDPSDDVTSQGVLVEDLSGAFPAEEADAVIARVYELAPERYREAFAKLDGYQLRILATKRVEECETQKHPFVAACVIYESQLILVGNGTCSDHRTKAARLAHEIGHIVIDGGDYSHANDDWYAAFGIADQIQMTECGELPKP